MWIRTKATLVRHDANDGIQAVNGLESNASVTGVIYLTVLDNIV